MLLSTMFRVKTVSSSLFPIWKISSSCCKYRGFMPKEVPKATANLQNIGAKDVAKKVEENGVKAILIQGVRFYNP